MKNTKKIISLAIVLVMLLSLAVVNVSAANSWRFSGYDTSTGAIASNQFAKIWYEVDGKGLATGNQKLEGFAAVADWKIDYYEQAFPHAGVQYLWLDGQKTSAWRYSGTTANWETEFKPLFWEVKYPYNVYEGLYTNINGKFKLNDPNFYPYTVNGYTVTKADVLKHLGKEAQVSSEYKMFGFGSIEIIGNNVVRDASVQYNTILGFVPTMPTALNTANLSAKDATGNYVLSDTDIADMITSYDSEYLTGPNFATGGKQTINSVSYWYNSGSLLPLSWFNPHLIMASDRATTISWTQPKYEKTAPYNYYQFLVVNGVVLDGRTENGAIVPKIFRYTGGNANPVVTYKYAFTELAAPHNIYMERYLDGNATGDVYWLFENANEFGVVNYAIPAFDNKLQSSYATVDTTATDISYPGITPAGSSVVPNDVAQKIRAAADKSMR